MTTSADITNRALAQIAAQAVVTGLVPNLTGGGQASVAANILYGSVVQMILREQDWEFSRLTAPLSITANTPAYPWTYEYLYPTDCLKVRQVQPSTWVAGDPQPVRWEVADHPVGGAPTRVILCNLANAQLVYTTSNVTENQWDSLFAEAVVRTLGSELALALGGRPDLSRVKLGEAGSIMQSGSGRDS